MVEISPIQTTILPDSLDSGTSVSPEATTNEETQLRKPRRLSRDKINEVLDTKNQSAPLSEQESAKLAQKNFDLIMSTLGRLSQIADYLHHSPVETEDKKHPQLSKIAKSVREVLTKSRRITSTGLTILWVQTHAMHPNYNFAAEALKFWQTKKETDPKLRNDWGGFAIKYKVLDSQPKQVLPANDAAQNKPGEKLQQVDRILRPEDFADKDPFTVMAEFIYAGLHEYRNRRPWLRSVGDRRMGTSLNELPPKQKYHVMVRWQGLYKKIEIPSMLINDRFIDENSSGAEQLVAIRTKLIGGLLDQRSARDGVFKFPRTDGSQDEQINCFIAEQFGYHMVSPTDPVSSADPKAFFDADLVIDLVPYGEGFSDIDSVQRARTTQTYGKVNVIQLAFEIKNNLPVLSEVNVKNKHFDTDGGPAAKDVAQAMIIDPLLRITTEGAAPYNPAEVKEHQQWFSEEVLNKAVAPEKVEKEQPVMHFRVNRYQAEVNQLFSRAREIEKTTPEGQKTPLSREALKQIKIHNLVAISYLTCLDKESIHFLESNPTDGSLYPALMGVHQELRSALLDDSTEILDEKQMALLVTGLELNGWERELSAQGLGIVSLGSTSATEFKDDNVDILYKLTAQLTDRERKSLVDNPAAGLLSTLFDSRGEDAHRQGVIMTDFTSAFSSIYAISTGMAPVGDKELAVTIRRTEADSIPFTNEELAQRYDRAMRKLLRSLAYYLGVQFSESI